MTILTPANAFPNLPFPQHLIEANFNPVNLITGAGGFWRADEGVTTSPVAFLPGYATGLTLSNNNLTIENPTNTNTYGFGSSSSFGKFYYEIVITGDNADDTGNANGIGIGISDWTTFNSLPSESSFLGANFDSIAYYSSSGSVYFGDSNVATLSSFTTGDNIGIAVDSVAQYIWFRKNGGDWNGNADYNPANGASGGGISFASVSGSLGNGGQVYPTVTLRSVAPSTITANFATTSFAYTPPSGYPALPSGGVTAWADQSGYGPTLGQNFDIYNTTSDSLVPATPPQYVDDAFNSSYSGIQIGNGYYNLDSLNNAFSGTINSGTFSVFWLCQADEVISADNSRWWGFGGTSDDTVTPHFCSYCADGNSCQVYSGGNIGSDITGLTEGDCFLLGVVFNGSTISTYQNGTLVGSASFSSDVGGADLFIGATSGQLLGQLYTLAFFGATEHVMTGVDWINLLAWSNANWGTNFET